jgi:hypothetical protein
MRLTLLATLLSLSACVGYVEYDPNAEETCAETSATIVFPVQVTEDACE